MGHYGNNFFPFFRFYRNIALDSDRNLKSDLPKLIKFGRSKFP
jgi:hypothetical protein